MVINDIEHPEVEETMLGLTCWSEYPTGSGGRCRRDMCYNGIYYDVVPSDSGKFLLHRWV